MRPTLRPGADFGRMPEATVYRPALSTGMTDIGGPRRTECAATTAPVRSIAVGATPPTLNGRSEEVHPVPRSLILTEVDEVTDDVDGISSVADDDDRTLESVGLLVDLER